MRCFSRWLTHSVSTSFFPIMHIKIRWAIHHQTQPQLVAPQDPHDSLHSADKSHLVPSQHQLPDDDIFGMPIEAPSIDAPLDTSSAGRLSPFVDVLGATRKPVRPAPTLLLLLLNLPSAPEASAALEGRVECRKAARTARMELHPLVHEAKSCRLKTAPAVGAGERAHGDSVPRCGGSSWGAAL